MGHYAKLHPRPPHHGGRKEGKDFYVAFNSLGHIATSTGEKFPSLHDISEGSSEDSDLRTHAWEPGIVATNQATADPSCHCRQGTPLSLLNRRSLFCLLSLLLPNIGLIVTIHLMAEETCLRSDWNLCSGVRQ